RIRSGRRSTARERPSTPPAASSVRNPANSRTSRASLRFWSLSSTIRINSSAMAIPPHRRGRYAPPSRRESVPAPKTAIVLASLDAEAYFLHVFSACDRERRRIEEALHDGVQQDLAATVVALELARELLDSDPRPLRAACSTSWLRRSREHS